jgi:hypothetical protein
MASVRKRAGCISSESRIRAFFQAIGVLFAIARTETFNWVTARLGIITTSKSKFVRSVRPERRNL